MSEYVCEVAFGVEVYGNGMLRGYERIEERREEIVRCRDCKFSTSMGYQCEWFHGDYLTHAQVVPEGFCAWGMPRKRGDRK